MNFIIVLEIVIIHTFDHICVYDINLTIITINEIIILTISGESID